jgi:hypothetical protein
VSLAEAERLVAQLEQHYQDYREGKGRTGRKKNLLGMLSHWIAYDAEEVAPQHEEFLTGITRITEDLAAQLSECPEEDRCAGSALALRAVDLLLQPKPRQPQGDRDWYLMLAEYSAGPLLRFLSREEVERQRTRMLAQTPRRLMYPKQLELLETAEQLLE